MPKALPSCLLTLIRTKSLSDAIVRKWLYRYVVLQRPMVVASLDRLAGRSEPVCCHSHRLAGNRRMVKTESNWGSKETLNIIEIIKENLLDHTVYRLRVAWSTESVDYHEYRTKRRSYPHARRLIDVRTDQHIRQQLVNPGGSLVQLLALLYSRNHASADPKTALFCPIKKPV